MIFLDKKNGFKKVKGLNIKITTEKDYSCSYLANITKWINSTRSTYRTYIRTILHIEF